MPSVFTYKFDTPTYKGETEFNTGLFINGQFVDGSNKTYIEYVCPRSQHIILTFYWQRRQPKQALRRFENC